MSASTGTRPSGRRALPWLAALAGFVLVALALGSPPAEDRGVFDPESTSPPGARGLVLLLESFGVEVVITDVPDPDAEVAFMFSDVISVEDEPIMRNWVQDGGTLVVADAASVFTPPVEEAASAENPFGAIDEPVDRGECSIDVLTDLRTLQPGPVERYEVPAGSQSCFVDGQGAFVVATPTGEGFIVALGGPGTFVNDRLDVADNAALAVRLLAPRPGGRVAILQAPPGFDSGRDLTDAIPNGTRWAILQLLVAFAAYAWFRARRLGAPIEEPQPVQIAGSELVMAVGNLLQLNRNPDQAAQRLRADLRHRLCERLGLPRESPPAVIADVAAARSTISRDEAFAALADHPVTTDVQLLELAGQVDHIRKEILHGI